MLLDLLDTGNMIRAKGRHETEDIGEENQALPPQLFRVGGRIRGETGLGKKARQ